METINLNSDSYTDKEIENLLHLNQPYDTTTILKSKQHLLNQLSGMSSLGNEKRREVEKFINSIATRLQNTNNNQTILNTPYADVHRVTQQGSNFIIENPDIIVGRSAKIENGRMGLETKSAPPGYINPINVRTITQAISLDSRFRPNYYATKSTNFHIVLPSIQKNVISMRVTSIELPITYYAISRYSGNSSCLLMDLSNNSQGWLLTLPDGNYEQIWAKNSNAANIETSMNNAILNAVPVTLSANGNATPNPSGISLTAADLAFKIDHISGRAFFTAVAGGVLDPDGFTLRFNVDNQGNLNLDANIQMRLGWQLGFRAAEYVATQSCVSEGICLISGPRYAFIAINDYQKNTGPTHIVTYANSVFQDNIITRINLAELQADFGVYQSSSDPGLSTQLNRTREYFGPVDIQRLHISLYDEFGRIIDLNNMDWSITLAFELLYN
jgi:hypothetical protein